MIPWTLTTASMCLVLAAAVPAGPEGVGVTPEEFEAKLSFQQGTVQVGDGLATFNLGPAFRYLDPGQSERVLVDAWGNPEGAGTLGMLFPSDVSPLSPEGWGVVITYEEDGYVDDEGAEKIDFNELLSQMQAGVAEENKEREKAGYEAVTLVGWAEPPRYDAASHKLYWAKQLKFGGAESETLNYNIRVLGRRGVLVLNAVAGMEQLAAVKSSMKELLPSIEFNPGHRYADFMPGKDKMATYGVGALIAGTMAAKAGFFKVALAGLLAFKKLLIVGAVAAAALLRKVFVSRRGAPETPVEPRA